AERYPDRAAEHKRPDPPEPDRTTQLPHRDALHDQREGGDQRRDLSRREEMKPYRGGDNAEREAGQTGHKGGGKCAGRKKKQDREPVGRPLHTPSPPRCAWAPRGQGNAWPVTAEGWLPTTCVRSSYRRGPVSTMGPGSGSLWGGGALIKGERWRTTEGGLRGSAWKWA